ncbi:hypothetical protein D3C78_1543890 [compost metagenome]
MSAHLADHAFGIAAGGDLSIRDLSSLHDLQHLREVMQLFFDQQHHFVDQILAIGRAILRQDLPGKRALTEQLFWYFLRLVHKRLIGPQQRQQGIATLFIGHIAADQPHAGLRRF